MERSNHGAFSRTQDAPSWRGAEGRASVDSQRGVLQKKRSNPGVRYASQPLPRSSTTARGPGQYGAGTGESGQVRKGSLRNVVRRIFGRRSKEVEPQQPPKSSPGHGHHKSEPTGLYTQAEEPEFTREEGSPPQRTLSAPLQIPPVNPPRVRSPYAVQFPQSARLKPLALGDPFTAPGSQLRRRRSLQSMLVQQQTAAAIAASAGSQDPPPLPSLDLSRDTPSPDMVRAVSTIKSTKRKSRSADDLRIALAEQSAPRKRSDEIRYWRESFQGSVLRASGFVSREPRNTSFDDKVEETTPLPIAEDPFVTAQSRSGTFRSSPPTHHGPSLSDPDIRSASGYGTELSRDIEDRVAKLEAGLHNFQRSLTRLTAERNRRTVLVGGVPQRRSSTDARTPSMLADTLSDPFALATLQYGGYQESERPMTSPQPPRTPVRSTNTIRPPVPPLPPSERMAEPLRTPSPPPMTSSMAAGQPAEGGNGNGQPQSYTFRSLYEMLTDERSARRRLEGQLRNMRQEITDLQYQVSVGSHIQSQRSSFIPMTDPMVGSSRLRDLLRETEGSPPRTAGSQHQRDSNQTGNTGFSSTGHAGMVSRFSGSESEAGAAESTEELATPYEAYQTPREEHGGRYPLGGRDSEGDMF